MNIKKNYYELLYKFIDYLKDTNQNNSDNEIKKYINSLKNNIKLYRKINSNTIISNNYIIFKNYKIELYNEDINFFLSIENKAYLQEINLLKKIYYFFKENNIKLDIIWQYLQSLFYISEKIYLKE
jgi:hypothetical protein